MLLLLLIVTFLEDFFLALFSLSKLDENTVSIFFTESLLIESITISLKLSALSSVSLVNNGLNNPIGLLDLDILAELAENV